MNKSIEKVLSTIKLKYYKKPKEKDGEIKTGIICGWCFGHDIVHIGGGFVDEKGAAHQICERCAVLRFKEEFKFRTLTAAKARRRRIFDVGYLFSEMAIDIHMSLHDIPDFDHFRDPDDFFMKSNQIFNTLFSKEEKIRLEEIEDQKIIEEELIKKLRTISLT